MGLFDSKKLLNATIRDEPFTCLVCDCAEFWHRTIKLNTGSAEFLGMAWANRGSAGLICASCGYVHEFLGEAIQFWEAQGS